MTWLNVPTSGENDLDTLLALQAAAGKSLTDFLAIAEQVNDAAMLNLCRVHIARLLSCDAVLAKADPTLVAQLDNWHKSDVFSEAEKAALDFTEQFMIGARNVTPAQRQALASGLGVREPSTFVYGLYINEAFLRFLTFFDVRPGAPVTFTSDAGLGEKADREFIEWVDDDSSDTDPRLLAAYYGFNRATCSLTGVDATTDEIVRLRSAEYHDCKFCQSVRRVIDSPAGGNDLMREVLNYRDSKILSERQKTALEVLETFVIAPANVNDELKAKITRHFTPEAIVELLLKEMFWMSNKPMISLGTDPGAVSAEHYTDFEYDDEGNFVLLNAS